MALAERIDQAAGFRFGVEIEGIVVAMFTECGGLSIEREVLPHEEGGLNAYAHQLPGRVKFADITLKQGLADRELWHWFRQGLYDLQVERRSVSIILYELDRTERERWDLTDVYPVHWNGPDLKADGNHVAVETLRIGHGSGGTLPHVQRAVEDEMAELSQRSSVDEAIDLPVLAHKVYDLLRQELRCERERLGRTRVW